MKILISVIYNKLVAKNVLRIEIDYFTIDTLLEDTSILKINNGEYYKGILIDAFIMFENKDIISSSLFKYIEKYSVENMVTELIENEPIFNKHTNVHVDIFKMEINN